MSELRRTAFHRALHRPNLILGGERELVLTTAVVAGGLAVSALNLPALLVAGTVWSVIVSALRMMAKADPQMSKVYLRHLKYQRHYPPRSRPFRQE
jgi:type IV secretion system protein VirB3